MLCSKDVHPEVCEEKDKHNIDIEAARQTETRSYTRPVNRLRFN